ncbi:MAG: PQQ-binding-like beta-propeller repeat protein [Prevotellaceae bacterium]|nr:PQQ-binding-like beta-propeller repeat protein [Prevotellaceae bacterium]
MKRKILRNIAILSAIFIIAFSIMLITTYFQARRPSPLRADVIETLKQLNDENTSVELQEQIRELDLLARKAYFIRTSSLNSGVIILVIMATILIISLRLLYASEKNIPAKQIDPVDDWVIKTNARRYVALGASSLVIVALLFAILSSPHLNRQDRHKSGNKEQLAARENDDENQTGEQPEEIQNEAQSENKEPDGIPGNIVVEKTEPTDSDTVKKNIVATQDNTASAVAETTAPTDSAAVKTGIVATEKIATTPEVTHNGFRGNNSSGVSQAKKVPDKWDLNAGTNIAWKVEAPRKGFNSPVINGNKVFVSGADDNSRDLYCYELDSGKLLWTLSADNIPGSPANMPKTTDDTGLAASTVVTNGKQVAAIFATGDLICSGVEGKRLWAKNLGVPENHYGYASSLIISGNSLIVQYDNNKTPKIIAFDIVTGVERWSKSRPDKISWSSPIIAYINKNPQLIVMGNPSITSYNPANGEENWRVECLNGEVGSSPCSSSGIVYGASEYADLIAIDATDGNTLWKVNDYLPEVSSPVATAENVFVATSYGVVACYEAKTGKLLKIHEFSDEFYSSPVIVEGKIYLFSNSGKMYLFSANSNFALINSFDTGEKTFATPAFTNGRIVVRSEKNIYCVMANG